MKLNQRHIALTMTTICVVLSGTTDATKLPSSRANRIEQNSINPEHKLGGGASVRSHDWVKMSEAPPTLINTRLGDRVEFDCEAIGSPAPTIHWIRGTAPLSQDDFENNRLVNDISTPSGGMAKVRSRLVVECVMPVHEGVYSCVATAAAQSILAPPTMLLVQDNNINNLTALLAACPSTNSIHATSPARISTWSPLYMDVMGNDVTLPCRAVGNPRPAIYWLDGDNELIAENEPRYKVLPDGDLFIYKLQWSDMGGYTCIASNTRSRDMTTTFLYPVLLAVTVYYESLCPDSIAFITRQLYPTWRLIGDYFHVKFVPFGKSKSNLLGGFNCQHGPRECEGNVIQSCALSLMSQGSPEQVEFVNCIMGSRQPLLLGEQCSTRSGVSWPIVSMCASSKEGTSLQLEAERQTQTLYPGPSFVPTITYDNVFNQNDQQESQYNFLGVVCRHLTHPKPSACSF